MPEPAPVEPTMISTVLASATDFAGAVCQNHITLGRTAIDDDLPYCTGSIGLLEPWLELNQYYFLIALCFVLASILVWNVNLPAHRQKIEALDAETR